MKPLVYKKSRTRADAREPSATSCTSPRRHGACDLGRVSRQRGKSAPRLPQEFRVEVEGVNVVKKHKRAANRTRRAASSS